MAEWEHKERNWSFTNQDNQDGASINVAHLDYNGNYTFSNPDFIKFDDWLDLQCEGGWEIFKISRQFETHNNDRRNATWCIFRRLV